MPPEIIGEEREVEALKQARRKVRICLLCVLFAAVLVGVVYYYYDGRGDWSGDVTLVGIQKNGGSVWREQMQHCI